MRYHTHLSLKRLIVSATLLCSGLTFAAPRVQGQPCSNFEKWVSKEVSEKAFVRDFETEKEGLVFSFSRAVEQRLKSSKIWQETFSEYQISRVLYESGLSGLSASGFSAIVSKPVIQDHYGIQLAAIECLLKIRNESNVDLSIVQSSPKLQYNLESLFLIAREAGGAETLEKFVVRFFSSRTDLSNYFAKDSPRLLYLNGLKAVRQKDHGAVVRNFTLLVNHANTPTIQKDHILLLLGYSLYVLGRHHDAISYLEKIDRNSNLFLMSLSVLSRAYLSEGKFSAAIGLAVGVQTGWMRNSFVPDPLVVGAISLNELCRYPEALGMLNLYKEKYKTLREYLQKQDSNEGLYAQVKHYLKTKESRVPKMLISEWIRTPIFLVGQESINLNAKEYRQMVALGRVGKNEQNKLVHKALVQLEREEYASAASTLREIKTFSQAALVWRGMTRQFLKRRVRVDQGIVAQMEREFSQISHRIYRDLESLRKTIEIVEAEVFSGAGRNIVWKNANSQFDRLAKGRLSDERGKASENSSQHYNWGATLSTLTGGGEIWEDEVRSLKAVMASHCKESV